MSTHLWRISHFVLALLSSAFLIIAALSGIILSTEPISEFAASPTEKEALNTPLAEIIPQLQEEYIEVFSIEVERYGAVKVDVIGMDEDADGEFYIHPSTGKKIGEIQSQKPLYAWTTTLHRSLFLNQTGRWLMGISVFFLLLLSLSGLVLAAKQTQGFRKLFKKIKKQNTSQYYHTFYGRIAFLFIFLMAFGGTVMFIDTHFYQADETTKYFPIEDKEEIAVSDFPIFKELQLKDIHKIDFPFSPDEEDYFHLYLKDKEVEVQQYTGQIVSELALSTHQKVYPWAELLHTGRGSVIWSIVLALLSLNILYFIYSGARISWKRLASKTGNKFKAEDAEIVILTGSENGSTRYFGNLLYQSLLKAKRKVFIDDMNNYQRYEKAKHLIIMAATYGEGEAPFNAQYFLLKARNTKQNTALNTFIIGFGSMSYANFCKYPVDVYNALKNNPNFKLLGVPPLIHNQSFTSFTAALESLQKCSQLSFPMPVENKKPLPKQRFEVVNKEMVNDGFTETFTLELVSKDKSKFQPGDLLAITPPTESMARYYSIGQLPNGNIILSIKRHDLGICSNYLYNLSVGDELSAQIKLNPDFHFPKKGKVLMIGNGTGIAPFIGMLPQSAKQEVHCLFGGRNEESFLLYQNHLLSHVHPPENLQLAYSKLENKEKYVQDLIIKNEELLIEILQSKGTVMICGSVKMRDGVLQEIKSIITRERVGLLENFVGKNQILMDCY